MNYHVQKQWIASSNREWVGSPGRLRGGNKLEAALARIGRDMDERGIDAATITVVPDQEGATK